MSPYTMPVAPTMAETLRRRLCMIAAVACSAAPGALLGGARGLGRGRRPQHGAAAAGRPAAAREDRVDVGRIAVLALDLVVVGEFFAGGDIADGLDEDAPVLDHGLAVGV